LAAYAIGNEILAKTSAIEYVAVDVVRARAEIKEPEQNTDQYA
jgi:hypothetical protein